MLVFFIIINVIIIISHRGLHILTLQRTMSNKWNENGNYKYGAFRQSWRLAEMTVHELTSRRIDDLKTNRADVRENCFSTEVMIDRDDILKIWNPAELTILKSWQKTRADVEQKWHPRWRPTVSPRHWMNLADRGCAENADVIQPKPKEWRERMTKSASLKTRLGNPFFPNARKLNVSVGFAGPWSTCLLGSALLERKKW